MKKKNLKPIELDAHFKYRCPKISCGYDHWLSLKQVSTKNFKVVCDCGFVFKPKLIKKIKIIYDETASQQTSSTSGVQKDKIVVQAEIPLDLQQRAGKILVGYGFTNSECIELTKKAYLKNPTDDIATLIKYIIKNLGELNECN
jgi:Holliday junction resolvasome RuvABC DNA-binding subunit